MALPVCQFVDRVGSGALQRLNLNDGENLSLLQGPEARPGPDFSPPALKRAVVNTLMVDGASIPASAYDNRIIRLPLRVTACNEDEMAEILETLHRELDRGHNVLKWHPTYNFKPVYFRTFRSPDYKLDQTMEGRAELKVTLAIVAEPFAYGDMEEQTGTIYNDPAAVANGIHFEITDAVGDIPTPLFLHLQGTAAGYEYFLLAVRRHGIPTLYWSQAEALVGATDTTIQANDPLMSGAGQNWMQTDFVTIPGWSPRLQWNNFPAAPDSIEYRGVYRVFARLRKVGTGVFTARWELEAAGISFVHGDDVVIPDDASLQLVDLGLLHMPPVADPVYDGYSREPLPVTTMPFMRIWARRDGGTGTLDWDYIVCVPADEELTISTFYAQFAGGSIFDGPNSAIYRGDLTNIISTGGPAAFVGSIPLVTPDQVNLYVVIRGRGQTPMLDNVIADTRPYTARYWPRYLYIR